MHTPETEAIHTLSFEQALTELESAVRALETGGQSLEDLVSLYQRGRALTTHCQQLLDDVELRIARLTPNGDAEPFDVPVTMDAI